MFSFVNERDAPSVTQQPSVQVKHWRAFEARSGNRHLLIILDHGSLRITSSITGFDGVAGALITQSGRRYQLLGSPETGQAQRTQLTAYALRAGLVDPVDVSDALWQMLVSNDPKRQ